MLVLYIIHDDIKAVLCIELCFVSPSFKYIETVGNVNYLPHMCQAKCICKYKCKKFCSFSDIQNNLIDSFIHSFTLSMENIKHRSINISWSIVLWRLAIWYILTKYGLIHVASLSVSCLCCIVTNGFYPSKYRNQYFFIKT